MGGVGVGGCVVSQALHDFKTSTILVDCHIKKGPIQYREH